MQQIASHSLILNKSMNRVGGWVVIPRQGLVPVTTDWYNGDGGDSEWFVGILMMTRLLFLILFSLLPWRWRVVNWYAVPELHSFLASREMIYFHRFRSSLIL